MNENQGVETRKRRSRQEVKRLVAEFEASGIQRKEFCRARGVALSTLQRHLKKHGSGAGGAKAANRLPGGRRIEVRREFDSATLGRVIKVLEEL
jgi:hypothetical protein